MLDKVQPFMLKNLPGLRDFLAFMFLCCGLRYHIQCVTLNPLLGCNSHDPWPNMDISEGYLRGPFIEATVVHSSDPGQRNA